AGISSCLSGTVCVRRTVRLFPDGSGCSAVFFLIVHRKSLSGIGFSKGAFREKKRSRLGGSQRPFGRSCGFPGFCLCSPASVSHMGIHFRSFGRQNAAGRPQREKGGRKEKSGGDRCPGFFSCPGIC